MPVPTRVAILDDHQSIIDGYSYRLSQTPGIEIVGFALFGMALEPLLASHPVDVLLLDVHVPTDSENSNPYPILHVIPELFRKYPDLSILVISMHLERTLIQNVMKTGVSGYILKDDRTSIEQLGAIVLSVAGGGVYLSQQAHQRLNRRGAENEPPLTSRQLEALSLCAAYPNSSTSDIAKKLVIADSTVRNLLYTAYLRLNVRNRAAAVDKARQLGLITPLMPTGSDFG